MGDTGAFLQEPERQARVPLHERVAAERARLGASAAEPALDGRRARVLAGAGAGDAAGSGGVVYWMSRDQRVQDNWALLYAQDVAARHGVPLFICFCIVPRFLGASGRHFGFMLAGLREVEAEALQLGIAFHVLEGSAPDVLPCFAARHAIGCVVADFSPLRVAREWCSLLCERLRGTRVSVVQVDAHNIVPAWVVSDRQEAGARTMRPKIHRHLAAFLTEFPPVARHPVSGPACARVDWAALEASVGADTGGCSWARPGTRAAFGVLDVFCRERLHAFAAARNDPARDGLSNMSPYFHFGQIAVQRAVLVVGSLRAMHGVSVDVFVEEAVVRRELADNFCFYNAHYDSLLGASSWARSTLDAHRADRREHTYTLEQLEHAQTHDELWNAAQTQMTRDGKMHGFMRMYWAKKILEWSATPEEALRHAICLNDRYSLDGRDPNGYVGCMWSICGVHDRAWAERPVFGKVRYMSYSGCLRKFDVARYISRYRK